MGLGPEAYVEEPKKLRDLVKFELKKALIQYEGTSPALIEPSAPLTLESMEFLKSGLKK